MRNVSDIRNQIDRLRIMCVFGHAIFFLETLWRLNLCDWLFILSRSIIDFIVQRFTYHIRNTCTRFNRHNLIYTKCMTVYFFAVDIQLQHINAFLANRIECILYYVFEFHLMWIKIFSCSTKATTTTTKLWFEHTNRQMFK